MAILIFLLIYFILAVGIAFIGLTLQIHKEKNHIPISGISLEDLTVIIPFRNEEERLGPLLDSLKTQTKYPSKILFVNDHSEDDSCSIIKQSSIPQLEIYNLPETLQGKKSAIDFGIKKSNSKYILQLDADVYFSPDFFENISLVNQSISMQIRPVVMKGKNLFEYFYELDFIFTNALNTALAGFSSPIIANGANLLYQREKYLSFNTLKNHQDISSGDDVFLLHDFLSSKEQQIALSTSPKHLVFTTCPSSFSAFIRQRLRWIGKMNKVKNTISIWFSFLYLLLGISFIYLIVLFALSGEWNNVLLLFLGKTFIDMLSIFPYLQRIKRTKLLGFIWFYELFFPLYSLLLLILHRWKTPTWKGREVRN